VARGGGCAGVIAATAQQYPLKTASLAVDAGVQYAKTGDPVGRFAFYRRVEPAYPIVQTGDMQPYANFIFKKGSIAVVPVIGGWRP
jgi:L-fucose mutarotase/ribose pyranase (RbsD/FucU family)